MSEIGNSLTVRADRATHNSGASFAAIDRAYVVMEYSLCGTLVMRLPATVCDEFSGAETPRHLWSRRSAIMKG